MPTLGNLRGVAVCGSVDCIITIYDGEFNIAFTNCAILQDGGATWVEVSQLTDDRLGRGGAAVLRRNESERGSQHKQRVHEDPE